MSDDHEPDAAAEAFEGVRGELALLRRAVERLAAERAEVPEIPDYSETLGKMTKAVGAIDQRLAVLEKANDDGMAPRQIAASIVSASADARSEDRRTIVSAGEKMTDAVVSLHGIVNTARRAAEQKGVVLRTGLAGLAIGALLWTIIPGIVARELPAKWQVPEWMAARTLGLPKWEAGQRLMRASAPDVYDYIKAGNRIVVANQKALDACRKRANKAGSAARCTVSVEPERQTGR
jgi:hypothetical protein